MHAPASTARAGKKGERTGEMTCKSAEREENQEELPMLVAKKPFGKSRIK
jgi:hypothetical protein